ncbi:MAG: hypothetical protein H6548_11620 [Chitinophagales bacterium]|nr:hypothetical protein [Chitinophagales bacterium]HQU41093.1 DUF6090 family protein [Chitinophagales bacterium]
MLRLFRRIRTRSLAENKFTKYLLYAVGEIILVVIGILIALSINNRNDFRKDRLAEKLLLENLVKDLERDQQELNMITEVNMGYLAIIDTVLYNITSNEVYELGDFVRHMISFPFFGTFAISKGTYVETLSSGKLSLVLSDSLKSEISDYYEVYYNYLGPDKIIVPLMKDLTAVYNELLSGTYEYALIACGAQTTFPHIDVAAISADPGFHRILTQKYSIMQVQNGEWARFLGSNEVLIEAIRNELDDRF